MPKPELLLEVDAIIVEFVSMAVITQITLTVKRFGLETSLLHEVLKWIAF